MIERQTFAHYAPAMRRAGWAVLPAVGKSPRVNGFNKWGGAPSIDTVLSWAKRQPNADIIYVPGLCQTPKGKGIVVVDSDDEDAIGQAEEPFGKTPAKVRTRRGAHRIFEAAGLDLGKVTSLRPYGLNIDIKHGQEGAGIVVGPPSAHEKDRSIRYAWDDCDETVLKHLPQFPMQALLAGLKILCGVDVGNAQARGLLTIQLGHQADLEAMFAAVQGELPDVEQLCQAMPACWSGARWLIASTSITGNWSSPSCWGREW